jgi:DNA ligase (NAD+)
VEREALPEETVAYRCVNTACDLFYERKKVKRNKVRKRVQFARRNWRFLKRELTSIVQILPVPAQVKERLRWFCGRTQMDIEGHRRQADRPTGRARARADIRGFVQAEGRRHRHDYFRGRTGRQAGHRTVGEKVAKKVVDNIANSRGKSLDRLLGGLGIHHVGTRVAHVLAGHFGSLDAISGATQQELSAVNEIGPVIAESVHDFFHNKAGQQAVAALKVVGVDPKTEVAPKDASQLPLAGKTVVVTGTLKNLGRDEIERLILQLGGKASGSVSKKNQLRRRRRIRREQAR